MGGVGLGAGEVKQGSYMRVRDSFPTPQPHLPRSARHSPQSLTRPSLASVYLGSTLIARPP